MPPMRLHYIQEDGTTFPTKNPSGYIPFPPIIQLKSQSRASMNPSNQMPPTPHHAPSPLHGPRAATTPLNPVMPHLPLDNDNDESVTLFSEVRVREVPLIKCGGASRGQLVPIPARPKCQVFTSSPTHKLYPAGVFLFKQDTSEWLLPLVECKAVRVYRQCTVYFFGAQEKSQWEEELDMPQIDCPAQLPHDFHLQFTTHHASSKVLISGSPPDYLCKWTGTNTVHSDISYRIHSTGMVDHRTLEIRSAVSVIPTCQSPVGICRTTAKGWLVWNPKRFAYAQQCPLQLAQRLACTCQLLRESSVILVSCNQAHLLFHMALAQKTPPIAYNPIYNCSHRFIEPGSVYVSMEGYLVSFNISGMSLHKWLKYIYLASYGQPFGTHIPSPLGCHSPHSDPHMCMSSQHGHPLPPQTGSSSGSTDSLDVHPLEAASLSPAELGWTLNHLLSLDQQRLYHINKGFCAQLQSDWDLGLALSHSNQELAVQMFLRSRMWTGRFIRGFMEVWRCQSITKYRFLTNSHNSMNWPVEYSDGVSLHIAYVESPSMKLSNTSGPRLTKGSHIPFLYPLNSTHVTNLAESTGITLARPVMFTPLSSSEQEVIFANPPLYSVAELTGHQDLWDAIKQLQDYNHAIHTTLTSAGNDSEVSLDIGGIISKIPDVTPMWMSPLNQLFGSFFGPIFQGLLELLAAVALVVLATKMLVSCLKTHKSCKTQDRAPHPRRHSL